MFSLIAACLLQPSYFTVEVNAPEGYKVFLSINDKDINVGEEYRTEPLEAPLLCELTVFVVSPKGFNKHKVNLVLVPGREHHFTITLQEEKQRVYCSCTNEGS